MRFSLNTSIHVQDSTVSQHTRPHLNFPCHENVKTDTLSDITALTFKHHKMVSITSSSLKGQISCEVVVNLIYSTIRRSSCVFIIVSKWKQFTLDRLWMWKSLIL
jgi:hypothetical protein